MAQVKISELEELYEASDSDLFVVVDQETNTTKNIKFGNLIPKFENQVRLIAISNTAPVEFKDDDKYYNTEQNLIFTAQGDSWNSGETPSEQTFYVVLSENANYCYDGTTLIAVSSNENILVDNLSGNETDKAPNVRTVNNAINNLIVVEDIVSDSITIPTGQTYKTEFSIAKDGYSPLGIIMFDTSSNQTVIAKYSTSNDKNIAYLNLANYSGSSQTTTTTIRVLYIKSTN